jgi:hypothetical protein
MGKRARGVVQEHIDWSNQSAVTPVFGLSFLVANPSSKSATETLSRWRQRIDAVAKLLTDFDAMKKSLV